MTVYNMTKINEISKQLGSEFVVLTIDYLDFVNRKVEIEEFISRFEGQNKEILIKPVLNNYQFESEDKFVSLYGVQKGACYNGKLLKETYRAFVLSLICEFKKRIILDASLSDEPCFCNKHLRMYQAEIDDNLTLEKLRKIINSPQDKAYTRVKNAIMSVNDYIESDFIMNFGHTNKIIGFDISTLKCYDYAKSWTRLLNNLDLEEVIFISDNYQSLAILADTLKGYKIKTFIFSNDEYSEITRLDKIKQGLTIFAKNDYSIFNKIVIDFYEKKGYNINYTQNIFSKEKLIYIDNVVLGEISPYHFTKLVKNNEVIIDRESLIYLKKQGLLYLKEYLTIFNNENLLGKVIK